MGYRIRSNQGAAKKNCITGVRKLTFWSRWRIILERRIVIGAKLSAKNMASTIVVNCIYAVSLYTMYTCTSITLLRTRLEKIFSMAIYGA